MHAVLNGIHLRRVISHKPDGDSKRHTLLFADWNHEIEAELRIGAPVVLFLGDSPITGRIVHFTRYEEVSCEITVQSSQR